MALIRSNGRTSLLQGTREGDLMLGAGVGQFGEGEVRENPANTFADRLLGNQGDDTLYGGGGNDTLYGHTGSDSLFGGNGRDMLYGGTDGDQLDGGAGDDKLYGESGSDELTGGLGNDFLSGGTENDWLAGGYGLDTLDGGTGTDTAAFNGNANDMTFQWDRGVLRVGNAEGADFLINIEWLAVGDDTYSTQGPIARDDQAAATESELDLAVRDILRNDVSLRPGSRVALETEEIEEIEEIEEGENGDLVGETTEGVNIYLGDDGRLHFADGEEGYLYLAEGEILVTHFNYTVSNGSGFTDEGTVELTITGLGGVGYYDMVSGAGTAAQAVPIENAGLGAIQVSDLTAGELSGLDGLVVYNPSNGAYGAEFLAQLGEIEDWVFGGGVLVIFDRFVSNAETILPGMEEATIERETEDDSDELNFVLDDGSFAQGPGGVLTDASLDGGSLSSHGFVLSGSVPEDVYAIQTRTDATHLATIGYQHGAGVIVYSSIPLDFYVAGGGAITEPMQDFATNVMNWIGEGADLDLVGLPVGGGFGEP